MSDISVMAEDAKLMDGHVKLGLVAGDHGALAWPLMCGMAKAKYHLLTNEPIDGRSAARMGLVSMAAPGDEVLSRSLRIARQLAQGSQSAIRSTKYSLNNWWKQAWPILDNSLALEMLTFHTDDAEEGIASMAERREPRFPSAKR